jgi:hypothetical protein
MGDPWPIILLSCLGDEIVNKESSVWDEHAFWRKLVLPQEDRKTPWEGKGYRWFRSPNVIPLEQWRQHKRGEEESLARQVAAGAEPRWWSPRLFV